MKLGWNVYVESIKYIDKNHIFIIKWVDWTGIKRGYQEGCRSYDIVFQPDVFSLTYFMFIFLYREYSLHLLSKL